MISIFILIGAYKYYAGLAEKFGKTKWHFGLLAIGIYLGFQVAFLLCYGVYTAITNPGSLEDNNYSGFTLVNVISWIFAIAAVCGIYYLLEKKFKKEDIKKPSLEIEEIGIKGNN
jgi:Kef-type K+ transport system membrane component KefB